jgi:hypothetical protein
VTLFFGLSFIFADGFQRLWNKIRGVEVVLTVAVVLVAVGVGGYFFWRWRKSQEKTSRDCDPGLNVAGAADGPQAAVAHREVKGGTEALPDDSKPSEDAKSDVTGPKSAV